MKVAVHYIEDDTLSEQATDLCQTSGHMSWFDFRNKIILKKIVRYSKLKDEFKEQKQTPDGTLNDFWMNCIRLYQTVKELKAHGKIDWEITPREVMEQIYKNVLQDDQTMSGVHLQRKADEPNITLDAFEKEIEKENNVQAERKDMANAKPTKTKAGLKAYKGKKRVSFQESEDNDSSDEDADGKSCFPLQQRDKKQQKSDKPYESTEWNESTTMKQTSHGQEF